MKVTGLLGVSIICILGLIHMMQASLFSASFTLFVLEYTKSDFIASSGNTLNNPNESPMLIKDITAADEIFVEYLVEAMFWEAVPIDYYDDTHVIVLKGMNLSLCQDISQSHHRQIFELLDKFTGLDILEGCPIRAAPIRSVNKIDMNFSYYDNWGHPTCGDNDNFIIKVYAPGLYYPIITIPGSIHDVRFDANCLYDYS